MRTILAACILVTALPTLALARPHGRQKPPAAKPAHGRPVATAAASRAPVEQADDNERPGSRVTR